MVQCYTLRGKVTHFTVLTFSGLYGLSKVSIPADRFVRIFQNKNHIRRALPDWLSAVFPPAQTYAQSFQITSREDVKRSLSSDLRIINMPFDGRLRMPCFFVSQDRVEKTSEAWLEIWRITDLT